MQTGPPVNGGPRRLTAIPRSVKSSDRTLDLLEYLAANGGQTMLSRLCKDLGWPKSSAHALLSTLASRDYVLQDPDTGLYRLGSRLWDLSAMGLGRNRLVSMLHSTLERLTGLTNETAFLGLLEPNHDRIHLIDRVQSPSVIRYVAPIGPGGPSHATSLGKSLLAHLPDEEQRRLAAEATVFTDYTLSGERLLEELRVVREEGVAVNRGERVIDAASVGAPILAPNGRPVAGLSVAGPRERILQNLDELREHVRREAATASRLLAAPSDGSTE